MIINYHQLPMLRPSHPAAWEKYIKSAVHADYFSLIMWPTGALVFAQHPLGNRLTYNSTTLSCIRHECNYAACDYLRFIFVSKSLYAASVAGAVVTLRGTSARPLNAITTFALIGHAWLQLPEFARPENGQKWLCCPPSPPSPYCCWGLIQPPLGPLDIMWVQLMALDWCSPHKLLERGLESQAPKPLLLWSSNKEAAY